MTKESLVADIARQDPILANAVSKMVDYIKTNGQHPIQAGSRRRLSMTTSVLFMRTVTEL